MEKRSFRIAAFSMEYVLFGSLVFLLFLRSGRLYAQQETVLKKYERLIDSTDQFYTTDYARAEVFARKALEIARILKDARHLSESHRMLSGVLLRRTGGKDALVHGKMALAMAVNAEDSLLRVKALGALVDSYIDLEKITEALNHVALQERYAANLQVPGLKRSLFISKARIYKRMGLYEKALESYKMSLAFAAKKEANVLGTIYFNRALIYHENLKEFDTAYTEYIQADAYFGKSGYFFGEVAVKNALGSLFLEQGLYMMAEESLLRGLTLAAKHELPQRRAEALKMLSETTLADGRYEPALAYNTRALALADSLQLTIDRIEILGSRAKLFRIMGDSITAAICLGRRAELKDSLEKDRDLAGAARILIAEKKVERSDLSTKNTLITGKHKLSVLIVGGLVAGILSFLILNFRNRERNTGTDEAMPRISGKFHSDKEANRKLATATANMVAQGELLQTVKELLENLKLSPASVDFEKAQEIRSRIRSQNDIRKRWDDFFMCFERTHSGFTKNLQEWYSLSPSELKICCFLKMNLSNKEIAQLVNIKPSSVHVASHRIKKKLGLSDGQSLFNFLHTLKARAPI